MLNQSQESQTKKEQERLSLLNDAFKAFKEEYDKEGMSFEYKKDVDVMVTEINKYYWDFISFIKEEKYVTKKGAEESPKLNIYKIISATELSIIKFQPIDSGRVLNAELASFVSLYYYRLWQKKDLNSISFNKDGLQEVWDKFIIDRRTWLSSVNTSTEFPFFLNSQVWMLIDMLTQSSL